MNNQGSSLTYFLTIILVQTLSFSWDAIVPPRVKAALNPELKIGVVQRFGSELTDELNISSTEGDMLTIEYLGGDLQPRTLTTDEVTLEISKTPFREPVLTERLVLSNHATFETAEESALQWQAKGIEVEVTQPERWQVWAKRDVYKTPLLRRLLLDNLKSQGYATPYLETEILEQNTVVSFVLDGYRYNRRGLKITSSNRQFNVSKGENSRRSYLYNGTLQIQPNAYGNFTLVNNVALETYLRGVVPHEIGAGAPYNAIKAQSILARTYALRNLRRFRADNYELCATTHCQVYFGTKDATENTDRAITETRGLVLTYNSELVDALYSSTTGGVTANFSDIWNGEERPYLNPVIDSPNLVWNLAQKPLAQEENFRSFISLEEGFNETEVPSGKRLFRWNRYTSLERANQDLQNYIKKANHPLGSFNTITNMEVTERSLSGRVLKMHVQTDKGEVILEKNEARSAFAPPLSTLFYVEPVYEEPEKQEIDPDKQIESETIVIPNPELKGFNFIGGGFGHGVGMSQYGSYNLGKLGWLPEQILQFYYPGTTIKPLDSSIVFYPED